MRDVTTQTMAKHSQHIRTSLKDRQAERDALLRQIEAALRADVRVVAAWLAGSLGRGNADALSDIDLWVVMRDDAIEAVAADPRAFVAGIGSPCLNIDDPRGSLPGGVFLFHTHFPSETGAHNVDWYWQSASRATRLVGTALLFQHVPIPAAPPPGVLAPAELQARLEEQLSLFWTTVLIAGKGIGRGRTTAFVRQAGYLAQMLATLRWLIDHRTAPTFDDVPPAELGPPFPTTAAIQFSLLDDYLAKMDALEPRLIALGATIPEEGKRQILRFVDFVRAGAGA